MKLNTFNAEINSALTSFLGYEDAVKVELMVSESVCTLLYLFQTNWMLPGLSVWYKRGWTEEYKQHSEQSHTVKQLLASCVLTMREICFLVGWDAWKSENSTSCYANRVNVAPCYTVKTKLVLLSHHCVYNFHLCKKKKKLNLVWFYRTDTD